MRIKWIKGSEKGTNWILSDTLSPYPYTCKHSGYFKKKRGGGLGLVWPSFFNLLFFMRREWNEAVTMNLFIVLCTDLYGISGCHSGKTRSWGRGGGQGKKGSKQRSIIIDPCKTRSLSKQDSRNVFSIVHRVFYDYLNITLFLIVSFISMIRKP